METNIGLFLTKRAMLDPNNIGYTFEGREITFKDWNASANRAAHAFLELGVKAGDRVGLLMMNTPEFLDSFFGLAKIGAIIVPLNWRLAPPEISYLVNDSGISILVYGVEFAQIAETLCGSVTAATFIAAGGDAPAGGHSFAAMTARASAAEPKHVGGSDDPLIIMYTAGTTGLPKGAVITHNNLFYNSCTVGRSTDWRWGDKVLVAMPLFHIGALIYVVINVHNGAATILMKAFDPNGFLKSIQDHKVTSFLAVPAMFNFLLQMPNLIDYDISTVRWALSGAAPVPVPLIEAWAKLGIAIQQVYGLTECAGGAAVLSAEKALEKVGSTGLPMFHTDIRIKDDRGNDVKPGAIGEIIISGPHVIREYWRNPQATAETIHDGWIYTGDLGKLDEEGFLYIVERKKDMIISGGENIYPAEVESILSALPQVVEVAVVGVPDKNWGETVCMVAVVKEGQTLRIEEVGAFCAGKLGKYKIPRKLVVSDKPLPRNATGKLLKRVLREDLQR